MSGQLLTDGMLARIEAAVQRVADEAGFGEVTIVVEKRRPVRIKTGTDEWLERRGPPPADQQDTAQRQ